MAPQLITSFSPFITPSVSVPVTPDVSRPAHADVANGSPSCASVASTSSSVPRKKVAIVGSGSAGIAALWALNRTHHDVYLYEAADRLGGHTNTVRWRTGKYSTAVDTGFIVLNTATYPNFLNFLKKIKAKTMPSSMSLSVSRDDGLLEWAGASLDALFCQRGRIFSPRMWRMLFDVVRFNQFALDLLSNDDVSLDLTIGQYLEREGYSDGFRDDYLIPMTAAVWSTGPEKCALEFPAVTLVRFMWNHHLLSAAAGGRPPWLTLADGSQSYIDAVMRGFPPNHLFLRTPVLHVRNTPGDRVLLELANGSTAVYDHVILACHGDQAYSIVGPGATLREHTILSCFETTANTAVLHSDASLMPRSRKAWSSWNYMSRSPTPSSSSGSSSSVDAVSLTYNMNLLQGIPRATFGDVLVTLNPLREPDPATVQGRFQYRHPLYTAEAVAAQRRLGEIQNTRGISYAGAWTGYGFHEDAFSSGLAVARDHLGARLPFAFVDSTYSRGRRPTFGLGDLVLRVAVMLVQMLIMLLLGALEAMREKGRKLRATKKDGIARARVTVDTLVNGHRHGRGGEGRENGCAVNGHTNGHGNGASHAHAAKKGLNGKLH